MKLQRRNCTEFIYKPFLGESDLDDEGMHTGEPIPSYGYEVEYLGNISVPGGIAQQTMFGIDTHYTHVLLMDDPNADIQEDGLIIWNDNEYEIRAVRPSINVLAVALRKRTKNHAEEADGR